MTKGQAFLIPAVGFNVCGIGMYLFDYDGFFSPKLFFLMGGALSAIAFLIIMFEVIASLRAAHMNKLRTALSFIGYEIANPPHIRSNLIHAILLFAESTGDHELASACKEEITNIRAETMSAEMGSNP